MRLLHRNPQAGRPYVRSDKYDLVRDEVLRVLPRSGAGWTTEELVAELLRVLPADGFPTPASVRWFVTAVRIDLEARGVIARTGRRKPLRYLLSTPPGLARSSASGPRAATIFPDWGDAAGPEPIRRVAR